MEQQKNKKIKMQEKKPTNAQMQRRLERAVLHLDRTKDTVSIYFSDKGLRLTADPTEGYCIIETGYHRHVFNSFTQGGLSRPYTYTTRVIEIAMELEEENCHKRRLLIPTLA